MKLASDYTQWYDGVFDGDGPRFERMAYTRGGLSKREQLEVFDRAGLHTPAHGAVRDLAERLQRGTRPPFLDRGLADVGCVVYLDELAHGGEGKILTTLLDARERFPHHYASLYHPPIAEPVIHRWARLGPHSFWIRQVGRPGEWRSNHKDEEELLSATVNDEEVFPFPRVLWAIDFVPTPAGLLAVDFNTAPELSTVGDLGVLAPETVRAVLDEAARQNPRSLLQL